MFTVALVTSNVVDVLSNSISTTNISFSFSLVIDATKVPELLEVSQRYKSIVGQQSIYSQMVFGNDTKNNRLIKISTTTEVKVCMMQF